MQNEQKILNKIKRKIDPNNSLLYKKLNEIENSLSYKREDATALRRERTRTNDEIAKDNYPLDTGSKTHIRINNKTIKDLKREIDEIKNLKEELRENTSDLAYENSIKYEKFYNNLFTVLDNFDFLFNNHHGEYEIIVKCYKINRTNNVQNSKIEELSSEIEELKNRISQLFKSVCNTTIPDFNEVDNEIAETEAIKSEQDMKMLDEYLKGKDE